MRCRGKRAIAIAGIAIFLNLHLAGAGLYSSANAQDQRQKKPEPQERQPQQAEEMTLKIGTELVLLDVTVTDSNNRPAMDLSQDQFRVFEDDVPQKIEFFSKEQVPISIVLTIDVSGSMRMKLVPVIRACINLVSQVRPEDEVALVEFRDEFNLVEEFTNNIKDLGDSLQSLVAKGTTRLFDALYVAADEAAQNARNRRKAVVLVTDGLDKNSEYSLKDVVKHLREIDVQVYMIGFTGDLDDQGGWVFAKSEKQKAEKVLNKIADETGGRTFFPGALAEVQDITQQVLTDLRTQYSIGYYPTNSKSDGKFRSVKVQVNAGNRRLVARTRAGYMAGGGAGSPGSN